MRRDTLSQPSVSTSSDHALPIYTLAQIRALEQALCQSLHIDMSALMLRAGEALWGFFVQQWPDARSMVVFCGSGHNGGDGYVLARLALLAGLEVHVVATSQHDVLANDVGEVASAFLAAGGAITVWPNHIALEADVWVDALLGIGCHGALRAPYVDMVAYLNHHAGTVLAVDVPTGLDAEHGVVSDGCVRATHTATLLGHKWGLVTGPALDFVGQIAVLPLGQVSASMVESGGYRDTQGRYPLARRVADSHKGDYGRVLVLGGEQGMQGAVCLAAQAAARMGVGYVTVATAGRDVAQVLADRPDFLVINLLDDQRVDDALAACDAILIGPGLGGSEHASALLARVLASEKPCVIDADGLNVLAKQQVSCVHAVLTPHPGEAGRLLGEDTAWVQQHRLQVAARLQAQYQAGVVLKGAGSVFLPVPEGVGVCGCGNPGMAVAGMGDVLAGMLVGLLGLGYAREKAMSMAVMNHAGLADALAHEQGQAGLMASDLLERLSAWVSAP